MIFQRSPEWYRRHIGLITGSTAHRLMCGPRRRATLLQEKIDELISGMIHESHCNEYMQFGIDNEDNAIMEYEAVHGAMTEPGYWISADGWGCTPDAFVLGPHGYAGLMSAKCTMLPRIQIRRIETPEPEIPHYWQCVAEMAATGLPWCDIGSYCPFMENEEDRLVTKRVERKAENVADLLCAIDEFNADVDAALRADGYDPATLRVRALDPLPKIEYPEKYLMA